MSPPSPRPAFPAHFLSLCPSLLSLLVFWSLSSLSAHSPISLVVSSHPCPHPSCLTYQSSGAAFVRATQPVHTSVVTARLGSNAGA
ncbi:hypothetical protein EI94DRAFT_1721173 [Lactarius quietus]|nr:hypothetical protein EI94DRAFT_1721173 [Lactarius quietus]